MLQRFWSGFSRLLKRRQISRVLYFFNTQWPEASALYGFVARHRRFPNIFRPTLYNDILVSRRLRKPHALMIETASKHLARDYIRRTVGEQYLITDFGVFDRPDQIPWDSLVYPVVVKATSGWDQTRFIDSNNEVTQEMLSDLGSWGAMTQFERLGQKVFRGLTNKLIVERKLSPDPHTGELWDYKFHCYHGEPKVVEVSIGRYGGDLRKALYSTKWARLPFSFGKPDYDGEVEEPPQFNEMMSVARQLSDPFKYLRVDLYLEEGKVYTGELTHFPANALGKFPERRWEKLMGSFYDSDARDGRI